MKAEENLEISPISGKESVIVEVIDGKTSKVCMDTGYMTNDDFSFDNTELLEKYEDSMPQIIVDNKYKDDDLKQFWYLTSIQFRTGMIYPMPNNQESYDWAFSPIVEIDLSQRMLDIAKKKQVYDSLCQSDLIQYLRMAGLCN